MNFIQNQSFLSVGSKMKVAPSNLKFYNKYDSNFRIWSGLVKTTFFSFFKKKRINPPQRLFLQGSAGCFTPNFSNVPVNKRVGKVHFTLGWDRLFPSFLPLNFSMKKRETNSRKFSIFCSMSSEIIHSNHLSFFLKKKFSTNFIPKQTMKSLIRLEINYHRIGNPKRQVSVNSLNGILLVNFPEKEKNFLVKNLAAENKIPLITQSAGLLLKDPRNLEDLLGVDDPIQVLFDKVKASIPCICVRVVKNRIFQDVKKSQKGPAWILYF